MEILTLISKWGGSPVYAVKYTQDNGVEIAEYFSDMQWREGVKELHWSRPYGFTFVAVGNWFVWEIDDAQRTGIVLYGEKPLFQSYKHDAGYVAPKPEVKPGTLPGTIIVHGDWMDENVYAIKYVDTNGPALAKRFTDLEWDGESNELYWSVQTMGGRSALALGEWVTWPMDYEEGDCPAVFSEYSLFSNFTYISGDPMPEVLQKPEELTERWASIWNPNNIVEAVQFTTPEQGFQISRYWGNIKYVDDMNALVLARGNSATLVEPGSWICSEVGEEMCYAANREQFLQSRSKIEENKRVNLQEFFKELEEKRRAVAYEMLEEQYQLSRKEKK